jgi:DnaJ-class molecular chaperone
MDVMCPFCKGRGYKRCPICMGTGRLSRVKDQKVEEDPCTTCGGKGRVVCEKCGGKGEKSL